MKADTQGEVGHVKVDSETETILPQAKEHLGLPEAKEDSSPKVYRGIMALKIPCFWPSSLQNCETTNCCFKLHHLWYFVIAAVGN